jgi:hypothetical protein
MLNSGSVEIKVSIIRRAIIHASIKQTRGMPQTFFSAPLRYASKKLYQKEARYKQGIFFSTSFSLPDCKEGERKGCGEWMQYITAEKASRC